MTRPLSPFDFSRGNLNLVTYIQEREIKYDEAEERAGLQVNFVAKSHLLLKHSGEETMKFTTYWLLLDG